jgi:hypothetical protein
MAKDPVAKDMDEKDAIAASYLGLRRGLGLLGLCLPLVILGVTFATAQIDLQPSISAYYYVPHLGQLMVGTLWAIGIFLIYYRGYPTIPRPFRRLPNWISRHLTDANLTTAAGAGALVTAILPTCKTRSPCDIPYVAGLHLAGSVTFLTSLAILSIWSFTETNKPLTNLDLEKRRSNTVYRICGWTILACLSACAVVLIGKIYAIGPIINPVVWLETIAILAFATSWLIKGDAIQGVIGLLRKAI